jgi:hypothetical protein
MATVAEARTRRTLWARWGSLPPHWGDGIMRLAYFLQAIGLAERINRHERGRLTVVVGPTQGIAVSPGRGSSFDPDAR